MLLAGSRLTADDSRVKVKAAAALGKIDAAGRQAITITLLIDKGWHLYANPVKNDAVDTIRTDVKISAAAKLARVDVQYPEGKFHRDAIDPKFTCMVYEDRVDIQAVVQRVPGDTSPLEIDVTFSACDARNCYLPATVKLWQANGFMHVPKK